MRRRVRGPTTVCAGWTAMYHQALCAEVRHPVRPVSFSLLLLVLSLGCAEELWGQSPTPFGTPSLLPMDAPVADGRPEPVATVSEAARAPLGGVRPEPWRPDRHRPTAPTRPLNGGRPVRVVSGILAGRGMSSILAGGGRSRRLAAEPRIGPRAGRGKLVQPRRASPRADRFYAGR